MCIPKTSFTVVVLGNDALTSRNDLPASRLLGEFVKVFHHEDDSWLLNMRPKMSSRLAVFLCGSIIWQRIISLFSFSFIYCQRVGGSRRTTMGRQAVQQQEAIPLLHDGPICTKANNSDNAEGPALLLRHASTPNLDISSASLCVMLLSKLVSAHRIKDQLHTLQNFKSILIQKNKNGLSENDWTEIAFLYQLLLEWSLGCLSPLPLRRTIHSILDTLYDIHPSKEILMSTFAETLDSITKSINTWKSPIDSLECLLSLARTRPDPYLAVMVGPTMVYLCQKARLVGSRLNANDATTQEEGNISLGVKIASLIKIILQDDAVSKPSGLADVTDLCWQLLQHRLTPAESFPVIAMAYGQTLRFSNNEDDFLFVSRTVDKAKQQLKPLPRISLIQGVAAAVPDNQWVLSDSSENGIEDALRLFQNVFGETLREAMDPEVRLAALKGVRTLASRSISLLGDPSRVSIDENQIKMMKNVSDALLETVLQAWENPPTRKMGNSLPSVFQAVVDWKEILEKVSEKSDGSEIFMLNSLIDRLLSIPPYRKGRYMALECLLPKVGARRILSGVNNCSNSLLFDLLNGVGDIGHNTGAMADLWAKLLRSLFMDTHNLIDDKATRSNRKNTNPIGTGAISVSKEWLDTWVPSLADALIAVEWKRRKRISSFCLPRVFVMVCDRVDAAAQSFAALLDHVGNLSRLSRADIPSKERETNADRLLWAVMEIIRYSTVENKLLAEKSQFSKPLSDAIGVNAPIERLKSGLVHFSSNVRITSFQAMEGIVQNICHTPMDCCIFEIDLWKASLPYASKSDAREYLSNLLFRLLSFLDRLARCEADKFLSENTTGVPETLPILKTFFEDFLLENVLVKQSTYPDSVVAKETFGMSLLECIIVFVCRDLSCAFDSNLLPKTGAVYTRKRSSVEERTLKDIRSLLVGYDVIGSLFSSLRSSTWEGTKAKSFQCLSTLIMVARQESLCLPTEFFDDASSFQMKQRGLHLASSPRQREADTGARILAVVCLSKRTFNERLDFVVELTCLLEDRLLELKRTLDFVLMSDTDVRRGQDVPLVHGIILALRLIVDDEAFGITGTDVSAVLDRLGRALCNGMQISLAVVADVRDGENLDGIDENICTTPYPSEEQTKAKVNPGAIGANGIFSSVNRIDDDEQERRIASQRIIVGSWLLTREACAALSSVLTVSGSNSSEEVFNLAGTLLITTLTSLKHTGAAYAAHGALQRIAQFCLEKTYIKHLPVEWVERLFREITSSDKIRDSTLRRSTGYALGFLSIMRSEISIRTATHALCKSVSRQILMLTLPRSTSLKKFLSTVGLSPDHPDEVFSHLSDVGTSSAWVSQSTRSRVHALNVLRMMILDAPLSKDMFPLVGDAFVSAIMGYVDTEWSIRNSAGMVFSACMLRVVDADKNATNTDTTGKNAVTLTELFQSYPALRGVLLAVLTACVEGNLKVDAGGSLPPILPILVLLYRVQPLENCDPDTVEEMQGFYNAIMTCLGHHHLRVRQAAARALCNMCGGESDSPFSLASLFSTSLVTLREMRNWNLLHGTLLLLKEMIAAKRITGEKMNDLSATSLLFDMMGTTETGLWVPPLCVVDAIQIVEMMDESKTLKESLSEACLNILTWMLKDERRLENPGSPELCSTASKILTNSWVPLIFQSTGDDTSRLVGNLSFLLFCGNTDVRVAASKAFKKLIYSQLDALILQGREDSTHAINILQILATSIAASLAYELSTENYSSDRDTLWTHPPTIRRLTRCLLEIEAAYRRMSGGDKLLTEPRLRNIALAILDRERLETNEPTPLVGNAIELLACDFSLADEGRMVSWIERLSYAAMPWRLRYSAACAVSRLWQDYPRLHLRLRHFASQLLQDEDPDARYVMVGATANDATNTPVTEHILSEFIREHESSSEDANLFMKSLVHRATAAISRLENQINRSDTQRKIFEVEDPNSYHEPALQDHATISTLWDKLTTETNLADQHQALGSLAIKLLTMLLERDDADTLTCAIFATLYSLLLITLAFPENPLLTDTAKSLKPTIARTPLHPTLETLIHLLMRRSPEPLGRAEIEEFCFLVPWPSVK